MNTEKCPVCGADEVDIFLKIENIPVHCNVLYNTFEEAKAASSGNISLGYCKKCSHVYNTQFDPEITQYTREYENSLHFSKRFQEYAENLAKRLVNEYNIINKTVIELGCGKGEFLQLICAIGNNKGIGFDESYDPANYEPIKDINFIQDFYSVKYRDLSADLVCSRHVLEHIQYPVSFLRSIKRVYFEVWVN